MTNAVASINRLIQAIETTYVGNREAVELSVCTFLCGGHLLIEDMPGVGKTTLAKAMAAAFGGRFARIQFTSDLLPSDILGISIWNRETAAFEFQRGPIFANIVLADEINRASPKTQSALLEAMSERQVTQEGIAVALPPPFMVIATQNAGDSFGTYPLPESQLDRFTMRLKLGYVAPNVEKQLIRGGGQVLSGTVSPVATEASLGEIATVIDKVHVEESVLEYMMAIVQRTRQLRPQEGGVSPRAAIALYQCARTWACIKGRDFVLTEDIQKLAIPVLAHRLSGNAAGYGAKNSQSADALLQGIMQSIHAPV